MKTNNLSTKIHRIIWSITVTLILVLLVIVCLFLSSNQWNRTVQNAESSLQSSTNRMNIQLEILTKYNEIIAENPLVYKYFSENYKSTQSAVNATFSINDYFQTFYNSYDGTNTDIYVYHNNYALPISAHSRYIDDLSEPLREKILSLHLNEFLWENTEDSTTLYGNMTKRSGSQMILAIPITDDSVKNILQVRDPSYDIRITSYQPEEDSRIYLSNKLINGQYISVSIPKSERYMIYLRNLLITLLVTVFLFAIIYITSKKITSKITRNLYEFIDYLMSDNKYLLTCKMDIDTDNEYKDMFLKIDHMVSEINKAHNDAEELRRRNTSLMLYHMQYQINPHLLYNALSALKWEAMQYGESIPEKIDALADYYRLSLTKTPGDGYTFRDEADMIVKYITLLSLIHNFEYQYTIELDEKLLSAATIPHILQPFVENAILHGINRREGGYIKIIGQIKTHGNKSQAEITLTDNGFGISPKKLDQIQNVNYGSQHSGLGLKNTISRIRLYYGQESTVNITSKENEGTTVLLVFPYKP